MATAKQIAWRKKFAAMAKAGTFARESSRSRRIAAAEKRGDWETVQTLKHLQATRKKNPRKKKAISAPSQITKRAPTKRLKSRRAANSKPGYFPNPSGPARHAVMSLKTRVPLAWFSKRSDAVEYAKALANKTGRSYYVD